VAAALRGRAAVRPALATPRATTGRHAEVETHDGGNAYRKQRECGSNASVLRSERHDDCDRDDPDEESEGVSLTLERIPRGLLVAQMM